ncbi:MAG: neutral/alkaline non-lysosomal ceramidase N-terminal domain-containing protein [Verrucomicrobia bacterium]|nr:neutral/alkaline non-lysosomal ceramidase N-terminal domain-containing protein [Verrucomicrobiota bacterium]
MSVSAAETWRAGTARANITPEGSMWMAGYTRNRPTVEKTQDLWVKALALQDATGKRSVVFTADLCGITAAVSEAVAGELQRALQFPRSSVLVNVSHTHSGPVVEGYLPAVYEIPKEDRPAVALYRQGLERTMVRIATEAVANLAPAGLSWGNGWTTFGVNRRNNPEADVPRLRAEGRLVGPVDPDVPVLRITDLDGRIKAIVFGYACHATVLQDSAWNGDYAGYAQAALETRRPGAVAMFFAGCGADTNPLPRSTLLLAKKYGEQLADTVEAVLGAPMNPVSASSQSAFATIELPYERVPSQEELVAEAESQKTGVSPYERGGKYTQLRARHLLGKLAQHGQLAPAHAYPIQVWRLGRDLVWIALGGEVVADYSLRLKRELGPGTWVAGYSNDVMAYIPSERVLGEGGYEGSRSMIVYGHPSPWAPGLEDKIIAKTRELAVAVRSR